jgi:hypothetical protein
MAVASTCFDRALHRIHVLFSEATSMTRRTWAWLSVLAIVVSFTSLQSVARAADTTATGTWTWSFTPQNGDAIEITLTLKQDGEKLTGKMKRSGSDVESEVADGKAKDGEVSFNVTRERNGEKFTIHYTGKVEGDTIKGKSEFERNGEKMSRDWEAKRSAK